MPKRHMLIVAVDGLRASSLGAYGNTSFSTPALDQFAAESFLLDACFAPEVDLSAVYRALWQSIHPLRPVSAGGGTLSLPRLLSARGYATTLVTDEPGLVSLAAAADFDRCVQLAAMPETSATPGRAEDVTQTALARLFAAACDAIEPRRDATGAHAIVAGSDSPRLVWVHTRGMYGPWDAPLELQRSLLDEGDPPPVEAVAPPDCFLAETDDPDAPFRYGCAYAAQVIGLDACWKGLVEAVRLSGCEDEWLVMLLGVRGFPLGEHRRVGGVDPRLYGEQLHVPWLARFPDGRGRLARSGQLVSHVDLLPTVLESIASGCKNDLPRCDGLSLLPLATAGRSPWRDALFAVNAAGGKAVRTAAWCLIQEATAKQEDGAQPSVAAALGELYVRPDDRWEANDVAKLCPDVVETLRDGVEDFSRRARQDEPLPHKLFSDEPRGPEL